MKRMAYLPPVLLQISAGCSYQQILRLRALNRVLEIKNLPNRRPSRFARPDAGAPGLPLPANRMILHQSALNQP